jgi:hypothetical protein
MDPNDACTLWMSIDSLKAEIVELTSAVLELIEVVKANTTEIDAIHEVILDVR